MLASLLAKCLQGTGSYAHRQWFELHNIVFIEVVGISFVFARFL